MRHIRLGKDLSLTVFIIEFTSFIHYCFFSPKYLGKIKSHLACRGFQQGHGSSAVMPGAIKVRTMFLKRRNFNHV